MVDDSLRTPHPPVSERRAAGKAARKRVPRGAQGEWQPPADRPDPVAWMRATNEGRLAEFIPHRVGRMVATPFTFLRGAADLMAIDLAGTPHTGHYTTAIGDAHLSNFGFYASPERHLLLDVNDFDQAAPGPWEWDVKRLAASIVVAGRENDLSDRVGREAVAQMTVAYSKAMAQAAATGVLSFQLQVFTVHDLRRLSRRTAMAKQVETAEQKARRRTHATTLPKFTLRGADGRLRMIEEPPLMVDVTPATEATVGASEDEIVDALDAYVETLPYHWQRVVRSYTFQDSA